MEQTIQSSVRSFIVDTYLFGEGGDTFTDDDSLLDKGLLDSTGVLELVTFLEEQFSVRAADADLMPENFDSINRIAAFVQRKQT